MTVDKLPKWEQSSLRVRVDFKRFIRRQLRAKSWQSWKTESVGKRGRCGYELPHKANHHRVAINHKPRKECNGSSWKGAWANSSVGSRTGAAKKVYNVNSGSTSCQKRKRSGFWSRFKESIRALLPHGWGTIERRAKKRRLKQLKTKRTDKW